MLLSVILAEEPLRAAARFDRLPAMTCCDSAKDMQSCGFRDSQTILNEKAASFPPCQIALCRGLAFFPLCQTTLRQGEVCFPPCETFIGWVMKEFPCRKVVRDGYEVHWLLAIRLVTVTDAFLAVAIGLEILTD